MLQKTKGIVLNYLKYGETSIIVRIYTSELGLQSYIVNGVRAAKSKSKIALFQPLTLLDLVVYFKKNKQQIFRISEVKCNFPFQSIPFNYQKSGITMFLTEILGKTLKEENADEELFFFLENAIQWLDKADKNFNYFHFFFLLKLSRYLGFEPLSGNEIFEQILENKKLLIDDQLLNEMTEKFNELIEKSFEDEIIIASNIRANLLDYLLEFYQLHIPNFEGLKSLVVLRELNR